MNDIEKIEQFFRDQLKNEDLSEKERKSLENLLSVKPDIPNKTDSFLGYSRALFPEIYWFLKISSILFGVLVVLILVKHYI